MKNRKFQFTLDQLANFIAEYTKDGKVKKDVWQWYRWFQKKVNH
jgi:hypothetical protein